MPTPFPRLASRLRPLPLLALLPMVAGCDMIVLDPAGDVARQQGDLIVISTLLMLLIIIPVMALTVFFAWRYRASNKEATYKPDWDHSTQLELVIWAAPLFLLPQVLEGMPAAWHRAITPIQRAPWLVV